jgi:hypothetical protein
MEVSLSSLHAALAFLWRVGGAYVKYDAIAVTKVCFFMPTHFQLILPNESHLLRIFKYYYSTLHQNININNVKSHPTTLLHLVSLSVKHNPLTFEVIRISLSGRLLESPPFHLRDIVAIFVVLRFTLVGRPVHDSSF